MTDNAISRELEGSLEVLASSAERQRTYLTQMGFVSSVDELALEFHDVVLKVPGAVASGILTEKHAAAVRQIDDLLHSFGGQQNAALWTMDQLDVAWQWSEVRRLATTALQLLRDTSDQRTR